MRMRFILLFGALPLVGWAEYPTVTMKEKPAEFFHLMPQAGVTHLLTEDDLHNAIWDMAVSPEGRFVAVGGRDEIAGVTLFPAK